MAIKEIKITDWLQIFKKQNQANLICCGILAASAIIMEGYSLTGTKYDVIEYCFQPKESKLLVIQSRLLQRGINKSTNSIAKAIFENFPDEEITQTVVDATVDFLESTSKTNKQQKARIKFASSQRKIINHYCTDNKKYIAPVGFYDQEKYAPANPRFRRDIYLISNKLTRLRQIPATNRYAKNYAVASLGTAIAATVLLSQRAKRYKREFAAFYEELKTDLNLDIKLAEQKRAIATHSIDTETQYIKDTISDRDTAQRYIDKPGLVEFEQEQAEKNNELVEAQRLVQLAKFKTEIAKLEAEEAKHRSEIQRFQTAIAPSLELTKEMDYMDYEALCPGKVGDLEFYDWRDLADDAVGIIIAGNSGSGKTSVAVWVAGWLTKDEPAQVLALDPHANVNVLWNELDIHAISEFNLIEKQLSILLDLLDYRRSLSFEQLNLEPSIIIFADEINACLENFEDKENMAIAIKRLGSEGRKYKIALIALNQSSNVEDIGISAQMRNNFLLVGLNATARQISLQWKKDDPRRKHVEETAYSCVVRGSVPESLAVHPTHHTYKQFKKKGNKPKGLLPINQLPLTIDLATHENTKKEKDWYEVFIDWKNEISRVPNVEEIKIKWHEVMGHEATEKQAETIHEYLTNLA